MSKLGPHMMSGGDTSKWIASNPAIFKFAPETLGASSLVPTGPLVIGKLDQDDESLGIRNWKAYMLSGETPKDTAYARFIAQTNVNVGPNRPTVNRYVVNQRIDVWEDDNEVVPDTPNEARWYSDYCIEMMKRYDGIGKKRANFSFATGTPHIAPGYADDIWPHLLPAVRYARDHSHYIALHEYMGYKPDYGVGWNQVDENREPILIWHGRRNAANVPILSYPYGWTALRYRFIYDVYFKPAGINNVGLLITEYGCDDVTPVTPVGNPVGTWTELSPHWRAAGHDPEVQYAEMLKWYDKLISEDSFVIGATIFTVGSVGIWKNWDIAGTEVETIILKHVGESDNAPPPTNPPEENMDNLLRNGSFETFHDADTFPGHIPDEWDTEFRTGELYPNPYAPDQPYFIGEAVFKKKSDLPPAEQNIFVWDGDMTYKVFGGGDKSFWATLTQELNLVSGAYVLSTPTWVDHYRSLPMGGKDYNVDPNQAQIRVKVNDVEVRPWFSFKPSGMRHDIKTRFYHPGGLMKLAIHLRSNWRINGNFFIDGWSLTRENVVEPPPVEPPAKHKAIVVLGPQSATRDEFVEMANYSYEYRHTMTLSYDDAKTVIAGGNSDSYVKIAFPHKQPTVMEGLTSLGIKWIPILNEPLAGVQFSYPFRYRYMMTSPFNAPRDYAGKKHEGVDYDITGGLADNTVDVLAIYGGVVDNTAVTTGGYGKYVRLKHEYMGTIFMTWYCHLDSIAVHKGQSIPAGHPVGEVGATGNVNGEHVHINIQIPGHGLSGYVIPDVIDPTPYIPSGLNLPQWRPTATTRVDILPFMRGEHGRQFDMGYEGGTQTVQVWHLSDKDWLYIKGGGQYEKLGLRVYNGEEWIFRMEDTSESHTRFYAHFHETTGLIGAPWMPRYAEIGREYATRKTVRHYLKDGCEPKEHDTVTDRLTLVSGPRALVYPESLARVESAITIQWSGGEQYDFALGRGCVAFRDKNCKFWFIGDLHGREDRDYDKPECIDLGW